MTTRTPKRLRVKTVKEFYNHWFPPLIGATAVTLGHRIYYENSENEIPGWLRRHEMKHVEQYRKYGVVLFLLIYLKDYLKGRLQGLDHWKAYKQIPFEVEARAAERR